MAALFFDSSSLVKRYAKEAGTAWIFSLIRPSADNRLYLARITGAEIMTALTKKRRMGEISRGEMNKAIRRFEREYPNKFILIEVMPAVIQSAMNLAKKYPLRGYDAVQLAAALSANRIRQNAGAHTLEFISADDNLNNAATSEGLAVDNPNHHS
jgi:predicted nucleic acid-binding protein